jgi:hypothetical protein
MNAVLFKILDIFFSAWLKTLTDMQIDELFTEWAKGWAAKHLTAEEITSEIKDGVGFIKKFIDKI